jgi:hypothetical protein
MDDASNPTNPQPSRAKPTAAWWLTLTGAAAGVFMLVWATSPGPLEVSAALPESRTQTTGVEWKIASACKDLKIITSVINTRLIVRESDENWRGEAAATIEVPVRLHYGVDLQSLPADAIRVGPDGVSYILQLPKPRRISVEVLPEIGEPQLQVGWGRWKSWAGEQMLAEARKKALIESQKFIPGADDMIRVRQQTAQQMESLVRRIAGEHAKVRVEFVATDRK